MCMGLLPALNVWPAAGEDGGWGEGCWVRGSAGESTEFVLEMSAELAVESAGRAEAVV